MSRVLITGANGFAGSHLVEAMDKDKQVSKVIGTVRPHAPTDNLAYITRRTILKEINIQDAHGVLEVIKQSKPDIIYHMAAQTFAPTSWLAPTESFMSNVIGTINVLEAVRRVAPKATVLVPSSSEEYGIVYENELPIMETNPLRPHSPYAVSKAAQTLLAQQYVRSYALKIIIPRVFNHTGPRRKSCFADTNFALQIARIEQGLQDPIISVGNLQSRRDFTDIQDILRAYELAITECTYGEIYNVCSGTAYTINDVLNTLLSFTDSNISVEIDRERMRPSDAPVLLGSFDKFHKVTNWKPTVSIEDMMLSVLEYWRTKVQV